MMKREFDEAVGEVVSDRAYSIVETVYMTLDCFRNKEEVYDYYRINGLKGFLLLYGVALQVTDLKATLLRARDIWGY